MLSRLAGSDGLVPAPPGDRVGPSEGHRLLTTHTRALLGPEPRRRPARIMVTMPSKAADDYELVRDLLARGMDCMRVNCAHDSPDHWSRMIENLRRGEQETRRRCRVLLDLPGPKIRTGPIEPGPRVVSWSPTRDETGRPESPARIWLAPGDVGLAPPEGADACLPVAGGWLADTGEGDVVEFVDARGAARSLKVVGAVGAGRWAESEEAAYVTPGTRLRLSGPAAVKQVRGDGAVGELPTVEQSIRLRVGDLLTLRFDRRPGRPAEYAICCRATR